MALQVRQMGTPAVSSFAQLYFTSVAEDTQDLLGVDYVKKLLEHPWSQLFVWVLMPLCCAGVVFWVYRTGGTDLIGNVVPVGTAASSCLIVSLLCFRLGSPWNHFSMTTALITVVFVMEMSTFERFLIKNTLRAAGTSLGIILAVISAEASDLTDHSSILQVGLCFSIFTVNATMAKTHKDIAYVFSMVSVTFAIVFFGYISKGWSVLWARGFSVLVGEFMAGCSIFTASMLKGEWHTAKSACLIVSKCDQMLSKILIAVDFAFARNMITSLAEEGEGLSQIKEQGLRKEVREFFHLDDVQELEDLKSSASSVSFATLPVDLQVAGLHSECRNLWADMQLVKSIVPHAICGHTIISELPNIGLLFDRAHPLYVQSSALAHSALVDSKVWQSEWSSLKAVRDHIQKVQEPLSRLFKLQMETLKDTSTIYEAAQSLQDKYMAAFKDISDALQAGVMSLTSVRKTMPGNAESGRRQMWRFDSFCQSLDIIIADLSSFTLLAMKLMRIKEKEPDTTVEDTLTALASAGAQQWDEAELCVGTKDDRTLLQKLINRPSAGERGSCRNEDDEGE